MPLWKLTPVDSTDPSWEASAHRAATIVRAQNEMAARETAAKAFDVATRFRPGAGVLVPPWRRPALVKVERIDDARFEPDGPAAVLDPSF